MKKIYLILFCVFFIFSCKTSEGYKNYLLQYKGISKAQLIDRMGVPHHTYEYNGIEYLIYNYSESHYKPQTSYVDGYSSYGFTNGSISTYGGYTRTYTCETTFYIKNGIVINIRFRGDACVA